MSSVQKDCVICKQDPTDNNPLKTVRDFYKHNPSCEHFCQCSTLYCFECSVRNRKKVFPNMTCHVCKKHFGFDMGATITKKMDRLAFMLNRGVYYWLCDLPMKVIIKQIQLFKSSGTFVPHETKVFQYEELRYLLLTQVFEKMECINIKYKDIVFNMTLEDFNKKWALMTIMNPVAMVRTKMIDETVNEYTQKLIDLFDDVDEDDVMDVDNIINGHEGLEGTLFNYLRPSNSIHGQHNQNHIEDIENNEDDNENNEDGDNSHNLEGIEESYFSLP